MDDFWNDKERLMRLAGMVESYDEEDDEESERVFNALYDREQQIVKHVTEVFKQLNIPIEQDDHCVMYDSPPENTVTVILSNSHNFTIKQLAHLYRTGMADDYFIEPYDNINLKITFKWNTM